MQYRPCFGEGGEVVHDAEAELALALGEVARRVGGVAEDVLDLVAVHHAHPIAPRVRARPLRPSSVAQEKQNTHTHTHTHTQNQNQNPRWQYDRKNYRTSKREGFVFCVDAINADRFGSGFFSGFTIPR